MGHTIHKLKALDKQRTISHTIPIEPLHLIEREQWHGILTDGEGSTWRGVAAWGRGVSGRRQWLVTAELWHRTVSLVFGSNDR
jgi:hypothetical protein